MPDVNNFDDFYNEVVDGEKEIRLQFGIQNCPIKLFVFDKLSNTTSIIFVEKLEKDIFSMGEKIRILVFKYDPDYYVVVAEGWRPRSDEIQQRISKNFRRGDIAKLPSHEREETLIFYAKTKNTINRVPDKSEVYEIIRERSNDEKSRILELRKDNNNDPVNMEIEFPEFT
jgi:hypothetical protein